MSRGLEAGLGILVAELEMVEMITGEMIDSWLQKSKVDPDVAVWICVLGKAQGSEEVVSADHLRTWAAVVALQVSKETLLISGLVDGGIVPRIRSVLYWYFNWQVV